MITPPAPIEFAIESIQSSRMTDYQLYIEHRAARGLIQEPNLNYVEATDSNPRGFTMDFIAEDGLHEQIGTAQRPLPLELIEAMKEESGLLVVSVSNTSVVSAQAISVQTQRPPAYRPRG